MGTMARGLASSTTLLMAVALAVGPVSARFFDEAEDAGKDVAELARLYADAQKNGRKLDAAKAKAMAEAMKKKYDDLGLLMSVYKPAKKGGSDGMENRLRELTKKPISKERLGREKALLLRMAFYNLAMHDVAGQFPPKLNNGKRARLWKQFNAEMKEGSETFLKAVQAADPVALRKAAGKMQGACTQCHDEFR